MSPAKPNRACFQIKTTKKNNKKTGQIHHREVITVNPRKKHTKHWREGVMIVVCLHGTRNETRRMIFKNPSSDVFDEEEDINMMACVITRAGLDFGPSKGFQDAGWATIAIKSIPQRAEPCGNFFCYAVQVILEKLSEPWRKGYIVAPAAMYR